MADGIPTSPRSAVLTWCQAHTDIFTQNSAAIGLTSSQAAEFSNLTTNYANNVGEVAKAKAALRVAVENANESYTLMRRSMSQAITDIRYFATQAANPQTVYTLSQVPPRPTGQTAPPPGRPFDFSVELLDTTGALQLRWKCQNPSGTSGTSYIVRRKLPNESTFSFVGVTGERRFVDNTFVAGPDSVSYTVQAQRADRAGVESPIYTINFGLPGAGRDVTVTSASVAA